MFSLVREVELSSPLIDFERKSVPCFLFLGPFDLAGSAWASDSACLPEPVDWSRRSISERLSAQVSTWSIDIM